MDGKTFVGRLAAVSMVAAVVGGCAGSGAAGGGSRPGGSNVITMEQITELESLDVFSIVQRLRPQWLQVRGMASTQGPAQIAVMVDGVRQPGSVEILRALKGMEVREVRYLNARDATTRYGTDMTAGAIEVLTRR